MNVELYTPLRPSATAEINGRNEKGIRTEYSLVNNNECQRRAVLGTENVQRCAKLQDEDR